MRKLWSDKRKAVIISIMAVIFTVMQAVGYQISMEYGTSMHQTDLWQIINEPGTSRSILMILVMLPVWWALIYGLFLVVERIKAGDVQADRRKGLLLWAVAAILLFLCWIPCFLAGYPGFYTYDAMDQVPQALYAEVPYSAHHPLLHTLLMGKLIAFGYHRGVDLNDGIALHSICQMLLCAVAFGFIVYYILKRTGKYLLAAAVLVYYALFPVIAMFSVCTTKDVIFSILLQLCVIGLYEMCRDMESFWENWKKVLCFAGALLLMCLFRKNGIYITVGILPFLILAYKKYVKHCILLFGIVICTYLFASKGLLVMLDAEEGDPKEAFSVPIQQIARVYNVHGEDAFTREEMELVYEGISSEELENYNPFLSDNVKNVFDFRVVQDNKIDYLKLWLKKGTEYPVDYIKAFFDNTYQAWYPWTSIYDEPGASQTYYFAMHMCPGGYRDSKWPELLAFYEKIAEGYYYQKVPIVRLLFSIGAMLWVGIFTLGYGIYRKDRPLMLAMMMVMLCCATVMLGPVSLVRYYLILFYGFPVSIAYLAAKR